MIRSFQMQGMAPSMEYAYLPGMGIDVPQLLEERHFYNLASSTLGFFQQQQLNCNPQFAPWPAAADPTQIVPVTEQLPWLNKTEMVPHVSTGFDACGQSSFQQFPNALSHNTQLNLPGDIMSAMSTDQFCFPSNGDVSNQGPSLRLYSRSSEQCNFKDASPHVISSAISQQACMYTSSSDHLCDADSSGSSDRERPLSRMTRVSPEETSWRNLEMREGNLGSSSVTGLSLGDIPVSDESSSADADMSVDRNFQVLSSVRTPMEHTSMGSVVSWISQAELGSTSATVVTTSPVNQVLQGLTLDPLQLASSSSLRSCNDLPSYKRQRACYTLESIPSSQQLMPSIPQSYLSPESSSYPMTSLNISSALSKDLQFPRREVPCLPKPPAAAATFHDVPGGRFRSTNDADNETRPPRKQNGASIEPQSVAARHRRKRISDRVRMLVKLIPGGSKMDTASMLEESIEYVKFLQLQVQLLESLGNISGGTSPTLTPSQFKESMIDGVKDPEFARRIGRFGSIALPPSNTTFQQVRPSAPSPLVLSEVLQQQLFKQKLCLVALSQLPTPP